MKYDVIVVGAGIVGMATARTLQQHFPHYRILVLEKESHPAAHQTGHNSGVIHAGVYYAPGSLKAELCKAGNAATKAFCDQHGIDYDVCGKLLVATDHDELLRMKILYERCAENGLQREWWSQAQLRERERNIDGLAAVFVPSTGIVSYRLMTQKMVELCELAGGVVHFNAEVDSVIERDDEILVHFGEQEVRSRFLVTCGGLQADRLVRMMGIEPDFTICPFRGEYYRLPVSHNDIVKHLIYPVPDPGVPFLGVHLTRMIDGSVTVGPNAVLAMAREGYHKTNVDLRELWSMFTHSGVRKVLKNNLRHGLKEQRNSLFKSFYLKAVQKYCPSLTLADLQPYPAGVRAQAVSHDGKLVEDFHWMTTKRSLHVCNAPSPAATSALPIAARIVDQIKQQLDIAYNQ